MTLAVDCQFTLGFKTLRDLIGHDNVGDCLANERYSANGDSLQQSTGGLLVWRKADNWTAFTDGYRTWINGPNGLQQRLNTERFDWEPDYAPGGGIAAPTWAPTSTQGLPVMEDSLGSVVEVMFSTSIGRTLSAWFTEASPSLVYGTVPAGWASVYHDPPRNVIVLNEELRNERPEVQAASIVWQTVMAINAKRYGLKHERWNSGLKCLDELSAAGNMMAMWWVEKFGPGGLQNASTGTESWMNEQAVLHQNQSLGNYVRSHPGYRSRCARYGSIPPMPSQNSIAQPYIDTALDSAFETLRKTDAGQEVYQWFLESGASAQFGEMGERGGIYDADTNYIVISADLAQDPESAAAWLVHEIVHAALATTGKESAEACYEEEEIAFSWQAQWWMEFFGPDGSDKAVFHDRLLALYLERKLAVSIRASEHYQGQCEKYGSPKSPTARASDPIPQLRPLLQTGQRSPL